MKNLLFVNARQLALALAFLLCAPAGAPRAETKDEKERKHSSQSQQSQHSSPPQQQHQQPQMHQEPQHQQQYQVQQHQSQQPQVHQQPQQRYEPQQHQSQQPQMHSEPQQHQAEQHQVQYQQQQQAQERLHQDQERNHPSQQQEHVRPAADQGHQAQRPAVEFHSSPAPAPHADAHIDAHSKPAMRPAYSLPDGHPAARPGRPEQLRPEASHQVLTQVNSARVNMHGVNARPLPQGNVYVHHDGALRIEAAGNRSYSVRPNGTVASYKSPRQSATFRPDGRVATLHTASGIRITRSPNGGRFVYHERADHSVVVSQGPHYGYVQRPVFVHNTTYLQRTYVVNNVTYSRVYMPYRYGGMVVYRYAPAIYYTPAYYHWAWRPWGAPVVYSWGWANAPWYGYYGSYFTPMPTYVSPSYWLADYLLAAELQEAYAAQTYAPAPEYAENDEDQAAVSPITPEVREEIALEVQRQIEEERAAAAAYQQPPAAVPQPPAAYPPAPPASGEWAPAPAQPQAVAAAEVPPALQQAGRVFVVSSALDVLVDDQTCSLSAGDVLRLDAVPAQGELSATVRVLSSKAQDCTAGARAVLSVNDLQEMYNNFHERIDTGLGQLKANQGGGLPPAPADAQATVAGPGAVVPAGADNAAATVAEAQQSADQAEADLNREVAEGGSNAPN